MATFQESGLPKIEELFQDGFPEGYKLWPQTWASTREELKELLEDGTPKLLTMDINISEDGYVEAVNRWLDRRNKKALNMRAEKLYDCDIGCAHCFDCKTVTNNPLMKTEEVFDMLLEAKKLGLKMTKFLGPGELLNNPRIFEILDFFRDNDIRIGIFTKWLILWKDSYTQSKFGMSSMEFCEKLYAYPWVSLYLSVTSTDKETETKRIDSAKIPDLFDVRNKALENVVNVGFNRNPSDQRLMLICTPVLKDNIDEAAEMYERAIKRNMPVIVAPTMVSGKWGDQEEVQDESFKTEKLVNLYAKIYMMLIENKLTTVDQIKKDGVSPYAGIPCNQFLGGFMQRKDGKLQGCPGNDTEHFVYAEDLRTAGPLIDQWRKSLNCILRQEALKLWDDMPLNNPCYAKQELIVYPDGQEYVKKGCGAIPDNFERRVLERIDELLK